MIACALVALLLLAYTYVGYPIAIGLLARLAPSSSSSSSDSDSAPSVTVCLPVFNGGAYLRPKIDSLLAQDYPADRMRDPRLLRRLHGRHGGGGARAARPLRKLAGASGVFADAGRTGKPPAINTLIRGRAGRAGAAERLRQPLSPHRRARAGGARWPTRRSGARPATCVLAGGAGSGVYWRYENWIRRQESRFRGVVGMTGPIAMMRRADMRPLPEDLILDDVWIPMQLRLAGKRDRVAAEDASAYDAAFEDDREFRRKVRTLAGNYQLFARMPALLCPLQQPALVRDHLAQDHAPGRAVAAARAGGGVAGARGARRRRGRRGWSVGGPARLLRRRDRGPRAGRLGSVARTFVVLNAAAVVGLWRYLTGRQRVTW